ncbi:MbnP family protein [Spirosoma spitsbergense]|uniref:MbnP family protein n=1 Tax=Spirosoma spitsbergense TaxID=431554 RepID=UPI00036B4B57|nr:MbnP family protein [Spirosoma spitsbergense]
MKTTATIGLLVVLAIGPAVFSCNTINPDTTVTTGKLRITFDNVAGASDLKLETGSYQNAAGEAFTITKFNYFVSNIRLRKANGSEYVVPQDSSYFLIQEEKPVSQMVTLSYIPVGDYIGLTFMIGVDSLRSLADISKRTGVLDPGLNDGMYWEWNSGYIFMKLEGKSALAPATQNNTFFYHVGGFGGGYDGKKTINNLRTATLSFNNDVAKVQTTSTPTVQLTTDALKVFNGQTKLSIAEHSSVMFDPYSTNIASNIAQMFSYTRIQTSL